MPAAVAGATALALAVAVAAAGLQFRSPSGSTGKSTTDPIPFDGAAAYQRLANICALGPRLTGSEAMVRQREMLAEHFTALGAEVQRQALPPLRHPQTGEATEVVNLIARWRPEIERRILLCCHYDTRPFPDQDRQNPRGVFLGANDGGSGVALLMTLGESMKRYPGPYGVDFVFFDAEEFVYSEQDKYFWGSTYFARQYAAQGDDGPRYVAGVLLDMVAGKDLRLRRDRYSMRRPESRAIVESIWSTAKRLGVSEFSGGIGPLVSDDHVPLQEVGGIPACDVIHFPWRHWHTTRDTPENCSAESLAKVGWVVETWLFEQGAAGD